jgi:hypothetical protein
MSSFLIVLTSLGYVSASIFAVWQLYDVRYRRWSRVSGGIGFMGETLWLIQQGVFDGFRAMTTVRDWVGVVTWGAVALSLWFVGAKKWISMLAFLYSTVSVLWLLSQLVSRRALIVAPGVSPLNASLWASVSLSTVFFLLALVFGIMYIEKERELKHKRARLFYYQLPALGELDWWTGRFMAWGWILYTPFWVVVLLFSHGVSHTLWCPRARQLGAALIWGGYGLAAAVRALGRGDGHRMAQGAMWAFLSVLVNVWGIDSICMGPQRVGV